MKRFLVALMIVMSACTNSKKSELTLEPRFEKPQLNIRYSKVQYLAINVRYKRLPNGLLKPVTVIDTIEIVPNDSLVINWSHDSTAQTLRAYHIK